MAPTLVASYFVQQNTTAATALTTPSFTPSNGEVIVVKLATWDTATAMGAPIGGSQTYASRITVAPGGFRPWCGIYTAVISGSPGSMTVSSTPAASARYSMTVERWSGAQLAATPATNAGGTTNGGTGAAASSLTTTAANSVLSWVAADAQSVSPATRAYLNSATDEGVRDGSVGSNGVEYYAYQAVASAGSTSFGLSAPTGMQWCIAGIEVQDAGGAAAPAFPPGRQVRRRLATAPRLPRGSARVSTPVRAQVNPPFPFNSVKQPRRLRGLAPRRGEAVLPVPAQVVVTAPQFPPRLVRARLKGLRLFRGHTTGPVPAQAAVVAPAYPPQTLRSRVRGLRLFRPRTAIHVPGQGHPPALQPIRPRLRLPRLARGRTANPTPAQIVVVPPAYPPQSVRTRLRGLRLFRGRAAAPVPPQVAVAPAVFVPLAVRARIRGLRLFRGRSAAPVLGHPAAGAHFPRSRPHTPAPRRGHAVMPVPPQITVTPPAYPLRSVRSRLKGLRSARGREAAMPVPAQVVVVPPKFPPLFSRIKQHAARIFRGTSRTPVVSVCDCETHRPDAGVTARPNSGITARPSSGITARGAAGMTARPDAGTTTRPCTCSGGG